MKKLNDTELALVNNLLYIKTIVNKKYEGQSLKSVIKSLEADGIDKLDNPNDPHDLTTKEWKNIFNAIKKNPKLSKLTITHSSEDSYDAHQLCLEIDKDNAVAVFRGTGTREWPDNIRGGYKEDTRQQEAALKWIDGLPYKSIVATGHSKGGNKAQYVAIRSSKITQCVAFDGQGFSLEFLEKYQNEIRKNRDKITLIMPKDDYVNILLYTIAGKVIYTETEKDFYERLKNQDFDGILNEHCPNRMLQFDKDGNPSLRPEAEKQEPLMTILHEFTLYLEKNASVKDKKIVCELISDLIENKDHIVMTAIRKGLFNFTDCTTTIDTLLFNLKNFISTFDLSDDQRNDLNIIIDELYKTHKLSPENIEKLKKLSNDIVKNQLQQTTNPILNPFQLTDNIEPTMLPSVSGTIRDFTEKMLLKLVSLVKEVEGENPLDITKWDIWGRIKDFAVGIDKDDYHGNIESYYKTLIDINDKSITDIYSIFSNAHTIDKLYGKKIQDKASALGDINDRISEIIDRIN